MNKKHFQKKKAKFSQKDEEKSAEKAKNYDESSPVIQSFLGFQKELDQRYDKRERLVKLSRDITILSKRIIFQLHRCCGETNCDEILSEVEQKLVEAGKLLEKMAIELNDEDSYQFARACTGGLQEFVEAVTFLHYIKHNKLLSYETICSNYLCFQEGNNPETKSALLLRPMDYILGVADLTGELMRLAINCLGNGEQEKSQEICSFLRKIHDESLLVSGRDLRDFNQKIRVMKQSMHKVENACYTVHLRGKEVPKNMLFDLIKMKDSSEQAEVLCS